MVLGGKVREAMLKPRFLPLHVDLFDHVLVVDIDAVLSIIFGVEESCALAADDF